MDKIVFITGATSGIGEACAYKFAENNYQLIVAGRREERLQKLKQNLEKQYKSQIISLSFDIRNHREVVEAVSSLDDKWQQVDILINNAGLAKGLANIEDGKIDDWETMIDTNIKGLLYMSREIAPLMVKKGSGHIINIGSIAGKEVYAKGNVYAATKHAVDALSRSMRIDLLPSGIKVSSISPGHVNTEFANVRFDWDDKKAEEIYKGFTPLSPVDVAETVYFSATRPKHVNIDDVVIMCTDQASVNHILRRQEN